jgi:hypothetical protein
MSKRPVTSKLAPVAAPARAATAGPAPPPTKFGAASGQAKPAPAAARGIAPPPTKFGAALGQAKPAPAAARGTAPPPTRFGSLGAQTKTSPAARAGVQPPPTKYGLGAGQAKAAESNGRSLRAAPRIRCAAARSIVQKMEKITPDTMNLDEEVWEKQLLEEEKKLVEYHEEKGWTKEDEIDNPYLKKDNEIQQFGIEEFPFTFKLSNYKEEENKKKFLASEIKIYSIRASRQRLYTGHRQKKSPQGHHLFSFEMLISGIESYKGPVINLLGMIGTLFSQYEKLQGQSEPAKVMLNQAVKSVWEMTKASLSLDGWYVTLGRLLEVYVQIQQYSVHATSGFGSGANSEGHHKEELRQVEHKMANGLLDAEAGAKAAKTHIEALFDLHGKVALEYREQSVKEGLMWLKLYAPKAVTAYQERYKLL